MKRKKIEIDVKRPHDTFFKKLMSDVRNVRDFIKGFLPEDLVTHIDLNSLEIKNTEKSDEKYKKYYLDMGVKCKLAGKGSELYFVFEHKSYPDKRVLIQILSYLTVMWQQDEENGRPLRPIIAVIFYHGKRRYNLPERFADYFDVPEAIRQYLVDFKVIFFDSNRYEDNAIIKSSENLYLCAGLLAMKHIFEKFRDLKESIIPILKEIDEDRVLLVLEYLVAGKDIKEEELESIYEEIGGKKMPSLAQKWLEQGMQKGLQQGMQQGMQQGLQQGIQEMVLEAMEAKFGMVPEVLEKKISSLSDRARLKCLLRTIMKAADIKEVEKAITN